MKPPIHADGSDENLRALACIGGSYLLGGMRLARYEWQR
jgi:hypothetical protein